MKGFALAFCALFAASAWAADPTLPPTGYAEGAESAASSPGPTLESVMLPKGGKGRPLAVISGQAVRLGEMYGDSRLVRVTEREAVLNGPAGVEVLYLTPGIEKTKASSGTRNRSKKP